MHETLWVIALVVLIAAYAAIGIVPLVAFGQLVMLSAATVGIPLELIYFTLLAWSLHANRTVPPGWYWRSFEHHGLLTPAQRPWVLTPFYLGALSFLAIALGIGMVMLGFVSAATQYVR